VPTLDARLVKASYKAQAKAVGPAWQLTTGADFALPATVGPKAPGTDLLNRYIPHVFQAAQVSDDVCVRLIEVTTLLRPPPALLMPAMLVKVFRSSRRAAGLAGATPRPKHQPVPA